MADSGSFCDRAKITRRHIVHWTSRVLPPLPYLLSVAGLGMTLAGFSGLVAAFRRGGVWKPIDAYRLRQIPEMALAANVSSRRPIA